MAKRVFLFLLTNLAVIATISIVMSLLGVNHYITAQGLDVQALLVFCAIWGMAGSFISLMLSKKMAKWTMRLQVVDPMTRDPYESELVATVHRLAQGAGLSKMPEVAVYDSAEVNAFATGPSRSNSLVAVSTGLLRRMNRGEVEGVLGHEVAHIANGDMVTMTLLQGVINAFVMFFARILAYVISSAMRDEEGRGPGYMVQMLLVFAFDIMFGLLGSVVVAAFSRHREYRADAGGARLAGREKMIGALRSLQGTRELVDTQHAALASLKISGAPKGVLALLMTHPPLEKRIERLRSMT